MCHFLLQDQRFLSVLLRIDEELAAGRARAEYRPRLIALCEHLAEPRVLKEVANGEMPEDEIGLRKEIDPALRAAILQTGEQFRRALIQADQWEAKQQRAGERNERDVGAR